jgi:hypothetical protein
MNDILSETRHSVGLAGRLACAGLLLGAASLLTALPASAEGLGIGGGLGAGASVGAGGAQAGAGATAGSSTGATLSRSSSDDGDTVTKSVDVANDTDLGVGAAVDVGKIGADLGLGAESATGLSLSRAQSSSSDDADTSETSAGAAADTGTSTDAGVTVGHGEDGNQIAIIDASVVTNAAVASDVSVRHPTIVRATK